MFSPNVNACFLLGISNLFLVFRCNVFHLSNIQKLSFRIQMHCWRLSLYLTAQRYSPFWVLINLMNSYNLTLLILFGNLLLWFMSKNSCFFVFAPGSIVKLWQWMRITITMFLFYLSIFYTLEISIGVQCLCP